MVVRQLVPLTSQKKAEPVVGLELGQLATICGVVGCNLQLLALVDDHHFTFRSVAHIRAPIEHNDTVYALVDCDPKSERLSWSAPTRVLITAELWLLLAPVWKVPDEALRIERMDADLMSVCDAYERGSWADDDDNDDRRDDDYEDDLFPAHLVKKTRVQRTEQLVNQLADLVAARGRSDCVQRALAGQPIPSAEFDCERMTCVAALASESCAHLEAELHVMKDDKNELLRRVRNIAVASRSSARVVTLSSRQLTSNLRRIEDGARALLEVRPIDFHLPRW